MQQTEHRKIPTSALVFDIGIGIAWLIKGVPFDTDHAEEIDPGMLTTAWPSCQRE